MIYKDRIFKCPTIRRRVSAEAYRGACLTDMNADFYEYTLKGASTSRAEAVEGGNREKSLEVGKDRAYAPRSMRIR